MAYGRQYVYTGKKFGEFDLRELRKSIGWVSTSLQQKLYGSETALKIVLSGKFATIGLYDFTNNEDIRQAEALMKSLGCTALMDRTYDTLSQGERQRVLIARALMAAPKLLILDEPCTGLDVFAREQLLQMIAAVAAEKEAPTIIYVTHHVEEILPCFTKTLLIKEGEVFAAMDTSETLTSALMSDFSQFRWKYNVAMGGTGYLLTGNYGIRNARVDTAADRATTKQVEKDKEMDS